MFAVVDYDDEQKFTVIYATNNLEEAKVIAFKQAKQYLIDYDELKNPNVIYKLTTNNENDYFQMTNEIIISYRIVMLQQQQKRLLLKCSSTDVVVVIKINNNDQLLQNNDEDKYNSFICNNYIKDIADDVSYEDNSNDEYWSYDDNDDNLGNELNDKLDK